MFLREGLCDTKLLYLLVFITEYAFVELRCEIVRQFTFQDPVQALSSFLRRHCLDVCLCLDACRVMCGFLFLGRRCGVALRANCSRSRLHSREAKLGLGWQQPDVQKVTTC